MSIHWSVPVWLWPLLLLMAAGAVVWTVRVYARTRPQPPAVWRRRLSVLRSMAFVLLVLAVAGPVLNRLGEVREAAELVVVLEDSASMGIADAGTDGERSRWEWGLTLAEELAAHVGAMDTGVRVTLLRGSGLDAPRPLAPDLPPTRVGTDLDELVAGALRHGAGRPVRAVVVVADGGQTRRTLAAPRPPATIGERAELLVVGVGDAVGAADRLLTDLRHPRTAHVGDRVVVEFTIDHHGPVRLGEPVPVRLSGPDGVVADTTVAAAASLPVRLDWVPRTAGLAVLELEVGTLDNERYPANNRVSLVVDVRPDRRRLLLLTARPDWNVRFLVQAARAESRLEVVVVHPTPDGMVRADSQTVWQPPATAAAWAAWDGVVLAGWSGLDTAADWSQLATAVSGGLGLCVVPAVGELVVRPPSAALAGLLPLAVARWQWRTGTLFVDAGDEPGHPLLAGLGGGLRRLPPVERVLEGAARADAVVVLRAGGRAAADTAAVPLLVAARHEAGRVLWCGTPDLWQLAFGELLQGSDGPAEGGGRRLLRNLLVWTAAGEEEAGLDFTGAAPDYPAGEPVRLVARWRDMRGRAVTGRTVRLAVRRDDADSTTFAVRTVDMTAVPENPGTFAAVLDPLPPGRYAAALTGPGEPAVAGATTFFVVTEHTVETTQVRRDQHRLESVARRWRGSALAADGTGLPSDLVAAVDAVDWSPRGQPRRRRWDPWSGWPFLVAVCALLGLEWFLRRRLGLL